MSAITTIKHTGAPGEFAITDSGGKLIATACEIRSHDSDAGCGQYRICIYGGVAHGKIAYASDFQDLNDKSVSIAQLPKA